MQPVELATMIAVVARPKTTPPEGEQAGEQEPGLERNRRSRPVSPIRRTIGYWLIGLGGAVTGR